MANTSSVAFFKERADAEQTAVVAKRGVIYARYSSDMQDTSDSIEVQVSECKKYALAQGIHLVHEAFIDRAETGTSTENRKSYQQLLALAQSRERNFDTILTFHTSRWGRGIQSEIDEYLLEKNGIKIIAVSQPFTADEAVESVFMKGILRKIDAYYSMQASKYTHAYQTSNAQNGFKNGGAAPDGYTLEHVPTGKKDKHGDEKMKSRLVLDTQPGKFDLTTTPRYEAVQFAFQQIYMGKGLKRLAKAIREMGWRSRYSEAPLSTATIRTWFTNPAYTGYMVWNRVKFFRKNGKRNYRHNPISKWVFSAEPSHPAIIEKSVFEAVAVKYLRRDHRLPGRPAGVHEAGDGPGKNSSRYLLSGLLECSECGANYVVVKTIHRKKSPVVSFGCNARERWGKKECTSRRVNMGLAEGVVMDALLNQLLAEPTIRQFVEAFNDFSGRRHGETEAEAGRSRGEMAKIEAEVGRMKQAILKGVDPSAFVDELAERQADLRRLQLEAKRLREENDRPRLTYDEAKLGAWVKMLREMLVSCDFNTRRELLHRFIKKIVVHPDRTAKMTWDLPATLLWRNDQQVPSAVSQLILSSPKNGITINGCGGWI